MTWHSVLFWTCLLALIPLIYLYVNEQHADDGEDDD